MSETQAAATETTTPAAPETVEAPKTETTETLIEAPKVEIHAAEIPAPEAAVEAKPNIFTRTFASHPQIVRAGLLAASITIAAGLGSVIGAVTGATLLHPGDQAAAEKDSAALGTIAQLSGEITSLRAALDASAKSSNSQIARLAERVDRAEKAQSEPVAKATDRLDVKPQGATVGAPDVTGSIPAPQRLPVVEGWLLRDVFNGTAMIESRTGIYQVVPGSNIPGLGRIEAVRRQDGRWVVVTPRGLVVSSR